MKPVEPNVLRDMAIEFGSPFMDAHLQLTAHDREVRVAARAALAATERYERNGRRPEDLPALLDAVGELQSALERRLRNTIAWSDQFDAQLNELGDE